MKGRRCGSRAFDKSLSLSLVCVCVCVCVCGCFVRRCGPGSVLGRGLRVVTVESCVGVHVASAGMVWARGRVPGGYENRATTGGGRGTVEPACLGNTHVPYTVSHDACTLHVRALIRSDRPVRGDRSANALNASDLLCLELDEFAVRCVCVDVSNPTCMPVKVIVSQI